MIYLFTYAAKLKHHIFYDKNHKHHIFYDEDSITGAIYDISTTLNGPCYRFHNYTHVGVDGAADKLPYNTNVDFIKCVELEHEIIIKNASHLQTYIEEIIEYWIYEKL
jgi:hypothetical protein